MVHDRSAPPRLVRLVLGENHAREAGNVAECRTYRHLGPWPPALLGSWDEAGDDGDLVRQGVAVGARAPVLERAGTRSDGCPRMRCGGCTASRASPCFN